MHKKNHSTYLGKKPTCSRRTPQYQNEVVNICRITLFSRANMVIKKPQWQQEVLASISSSTSIPAETTCSRSTSQHASAIGSQQLIRRANILKNASTCSITKSSQPLFSPDNKVKMISACSVIQWQHHLRIYQIHPVSTASYVNGQVQGE